jgi:hypothetical protein
VAGVLQADACYAVSELLVSRGRLRSCSVQVLTVSARGVRRLNVRNWEKAVADGTVEQMFGMNIKQEGIEVLGDQVSVFPHASIERL